MTLMLFLACLSLSVYPLAIYPLLAALGAHLRPRHWTCGEMTERVAFVISVFNEEKRIRAKLENTLSVEQPRGGMDVIVVSDGSTDDTPTIVAEFAERGVRWLPRPRRGKEYAQIDAVAACDAEVIIFSDASTKLDSHSLVEILRPLADPHVGGVSGRDVVETTDAHSGENAFIRYEMSLRRAESLCGSLVGLSGCFFAVRRQVARDLIGDVPSDLGSALICAMQGLRAVSQDSATCTYAPTQGTEKLYRRFRRTAVRGLRCLYAYRRSISWQRPIISWQIISHKWLRYFSPLAACAALACGLWGAALGETWALATMALASLILTAAVASLVVPSKALGVFRPAGFALITNVAVLAAWSSLARGEKSITWTPTAR